MQPSFTLLSVFSSVFLGLAVSEGDDSAPVFFTNTSGNMFLQPPGSESQATAAATAVAGGGANYATLDSDVGGGYGVQGTSATVGQLHHKGTVAKKVGRLDFDFFGCD